MLLSLRQALRETLQTQPLFHWHRPPPPQGTRNHLHPQAFLPLRAQACPKTSLTQRREGHLTPPLCPGRPEPSACTPSVAGGSLPPRGPTAPLPRPRLQGPGPHRLSPAVTSHLTAGCSQASPLPPSSEQPCYHRDGHLLHSGHATAKEAAWDWAPAALTRTGVRGQAPPAQQGGPLGAEGPDPERRRRTCLSSGTPHPLPVSCYKQDRSQRPLHSQLSECFFPLFFNLQLKIILDKCPL